MVSELRIVVDTNVLVSALLFPNSKPGLAVKLALSKGSLLVSAETASELNEVLRRRKFDRFATIEQRLEFVAALVRDSILVEIHERIAACRDPKDDKFLEVAVSGRARLVVSGDMDLLSLSPFRGIHVLSPAEFLEGAWCSAESRDAEAPLEFPIFVVANSAGDIVIVEAEGVTCLLGYETRELAELYISLTGDLSLKILSIAGWDAVRPLAASMIKQGVSTMLLNAVLRPTWFKFLDLNQFLDD